LGVRFWGALCLFAAMVSAGAGDVWVAGEGGYQSYRIPAVVRTGRGTLLAFCEGRKGGSKDWGDIDVLVKRSRDGGRTWGAAGVVADFGTDTVGNPAPVVDRKTGVIWLLLTRNPGDVKERDIQPGLAGATRTVWVTHSGDDGVSWAKPEEITRAVKRPEWSWYATGPGSGIQTAAGRLAVACDHREEGGSYSHVIYSDDDGKSWKIGGSAGPKCNESTVAELRDGSLMLNMRSDAGEHRRAVSVSRDGGLTWSKPALDRALMEPVCEGSLIRFGKMLLFSNPAAVKRENMTVKVSRDDGKTWSAGKVIDPGPSAYSNLVAVNRKTVGLLYERGHRGAYERIRFVSIPVKSIERSK
jgi:sialidase-1